MGSSKWIVAGAVGVLFAGAVGGVLAWRARSAPASVVEAVLVEDVAILHEKDEAAARGSSIDRLVAVDVRTGDVRARRDGSGRLGGVNHGWMIDGEGLSLLDPSTLRVGESARDVAGRTPELVGSKDLCFAGDTVRFTSSDGRYLSLDLTSREVSSSPTSSCQRGTPSWTTRALTTPAGTLSVEPVPSSNRSSLRIVAPSGEGKLGPELESPALVVRLELGRLVSLVDGAVVVLHRQAGGAAIRVVSLSDGATRWEAAVPFQALSFAHASATSMLVVGQGHALAFDVQSGRALFHRGP